MQQNLVYIVPVAGLLALAYAFWKAQWIRGQDAGTDRMQELAGYIQEGAMAFLSSEYKYLAVFVVVVSGLLGGIYFAQDSGASAGISAGLMAMVAVSFVAGAVCSGLAGYAGMRVATDANVRTTHAARDGLPKALNVSFSGGAVMGMSVVGLALFGLGLLLVIFPGLFGVSWGATGQEVIEQAGKLGAMLAVVTGFSLGASSIALFARVGGGIYTKAADVGADLVGKVEAGIPEDDPRNPATIADNVGDNVGDVAGMGADLFESYIGSIIGAMVLGVAWSVSIANSDAAATMALGPVLLPLMIAASGVVISIICTFLVRVSEDGDPSAALHLGTWVAAGVTAAVTGGLCYWMLPEALELRGKTYTWWGPFVAVIGGLAAGVAIGKVTEYYTSDHYKPVQEIAKESKMGTAPNIIAGLGLGMWSTAWPVIFITVAIAIAYYFSSLYGIALAALGMLATTGIQLAVDAFGPIADNAGGIAEMSELPGEVRDRTDRLDAVGNTTAAIGKGFAIGSAALTALALFTAFTQQANVTKIDLLEPIVMIGVFLGAILPFIFSAMAMKAVGRSASAMIEEVRRQFREIDGLLEGTAKAEHAKCVEISTNAALREMIAPGMMALSVAVIAGFISPLLLGGLLAGVTTAGVAMAIFMSNAGGAWDNAKKFVEAGNFGGKGSDAHKAAVAGDTVGDPFKDTAGPALNILIKLMSVVALVLAPIIAIESAEGAGAENASAAAIVQPLDNSAAAETVAKANDKAAVETDAVAKDTVAKANSAAAATGEAAAKATEGDATP